MLASPLLTDHVVTLRRFRLNEAPALYEAVRETLPDLIPWLSWAKPDYSLADAQQYLYSADQSWEKELHYVFAVTDAQDGTLLGTVSLGSIHSFHRFCNLGYWIRSSRRGRGLAGRATLLAARFGLETLRLNRIEIVVAVENQASLRVAEKSGAHREGILRQRIVVGERIYDAVMFSLIRADFGLSPL